MPSLAELLSGALDTISAPGRYTRGALAGRPGESMGGRDMLEAWGALSPNTPGLDFGDVAGFLAEAVVDPLNLIPVGALGAALGMSRKAVPLSEVAAKALTSSDEAYKAFEVAKAMPKSVYKQMARDEFDKGIQSFAQDQMSKLQNTINATGDVNIINPHSGLRKWSEPDRGVRDLQDLLRKRYWKVEDKEGLGGAFYSGQGLLNHGKYGSVYPSIPDLAPLMRDNSGSVMRSGRRNFGLNYNKQSRLPGDWWQSTGWHEGNHYLQDHDNLHPEVVKYIAKELDDAAKNNPKFGEGFTPFGGMNADETLKYYMNPIEIDSRIQEIRRGMDSAGVPRPDLPNAGDDLGPTISFLQDSPDWASGNPIRELRRLFSDKQLAMLIRNLPMVGAVAGPAAAAVYGAGEA